MRTLHRGGLATLVLLLSMLLVFAACGSDDDDATDADGAAAPSEPVVVPTVSDTGSHQRHPNLGAADTSTSASDTSSAASYQSPRHDDASGDLVVERLIISDAPPSSESSNPWKLESRVAPTTMNAIYDSLIAVDPASTVSFTPA